MRGNTHAGQSALNADEERILLRMENEGGDIVPDDYAMEITPANGLGLRRIQERARLLGGRFTVESRSVPGNRIVIAIPVGGKER